MQGCNNMTKTVRLGASFYLTLFFCQTMCILARPGSTDANPKSLNLNPLDRRPQTDVLTFETENAQQNRRGEHKLQQQNRVVNGERTAGMSKTENRPNEERSQLDFHDASQYEGSYVPAHPHRDQDDRRYSEITESSGKPARQRQLTRAKTPNSLPLDNERQHTTSEIQDSLLNDYGQRNVVANDSQKDLSMTESSKAENKSTDRSQHNESVRDEPKSETKDVPENQFSDDTKNEVWRLVHTAKHDRDDVGKHYEHDVSVTGSQSEHDVSAAGSQSEHDVSVTRSQSEHDVSVTGSQSEHELSATGSQNEHDGSATESQSEYVVSVPGRQTERNANSSAVTGHNTSKPELKPGTKRSSMSRNTTHPIRNRPNPAGQKTQDWQDGAEDMTEDQKDDCELKQLRCSPFYMSPCDKVNPAPGAHYSGNCRAKKRWKPCGGVKTADGRSACFCSGRAASCCANLTAIPDLSINNTNKPVIYLNFTNNNVTVLTKDFLRNNTQLIWLVLNRNNISLVHNDSLEDMRKLHRFELAFNKFKEGISPFNFVSAINTVRNLQVLDLNKTHFARAKPREKGITWIVRHLRFRHLKQLFIDGGHKRTFYLSDVDPARLPKLCKFSIKSHFLEKIYCCSVKSINDSMDYDDDAVDQYDTDPYTDPASGESSCISPESRHEPYCRNFALPNLRLLVLANNSLVRIPSFCKNGSQESVVPNLFGLSLAINAVVHPERLQFQCLPSLLTMALTGNPLKYIQSNLFQELVSLQEVDLRFTNVMIAEKYAFNHSQLKMVTIQSSNWFIDQHHEACCISPLLFEGTNLDVVDLSYNNFRFADNVTIETFLSPLRSVRKLKMADIGLYEIPEIIQRYFRNLEFFDFERNMLSQISSDIFDNMANLTYLDLSDNHLASPPAETLRTLVVDRHICVDLQWNPYSCTCDLLEFLDLFKAHRERRRPHETDTRSPFVPSRLRPALKGYFKGDHYHCYAPESVYNRSLQSVELTVHNCALSVTQELIVLIVCILIIFCVLTYTLLYKYRWQVRFWLYTLHVRLTRPQTTGSHVQQPRRRPRFNAFVSYCKDDSHFVLTKVLPILERNSRLPLCIHERDFIPGRYISQNVVERMEESKHILLILSNAFLQNDWCRFELFVAQKYGLIHRQIPVTTLVLENLRMDLMDAHVITLLQARPGIEWPGNDNPRDLANFWVHLAQTLGSRPAPIGNRIRPGHDRARPGQDRDRPRQDRA